MKSSIATQGIVLARTNFQEADRIITVLTPDHGKVRLMAKGVRRERSKLVGGIELFSISNITFLPGRREIGTLVSSRLKTHFEDIVKNIDRTMLGYDVLKRLDVLTEDAAGEEYFRALAAVLAGLNNAKLPIELVELWFIMRLLKVTGHSPNLRSDPSGRPLAADQRHCFSHGDMAFRPHEDGEFSAGHIKLLRLCAGSSSPEVLAVVNGTDKVLSQTLELARSMASHHLRY